MKFKLACLCLSIAQFAAFAYADALPPPGSMKKVTIELSPDTSRALLDSVRFQNQQDVQLPKDGVFGPCTVQKKDWNNGNVGVYQARAISCLTRSSCFYKAAPRCTMTFTTYKGTSDFFKITKEEPVDAIN